MSSLCVGEAYVALCDGRLERRRLTSFHDTELAPAPHAAALTGNSDLGAGGG